MNAKIMAINFKKYPNIFPIYETEESPEISLGYLIHDRIREFGGDILCLNTRNHTDYAGDGCYTDNFEDMLNFK